MTNGKRRKCHFQDPKLKHFLGKHAPRPPPVPLWSAFRALKSYATPVLQGNLTISDKLSLKQRKSSSLRLTFSQASQ